jgi:uncharacterized membrane protein YhdT
MLPISFLEGLTLSEKKHGKTLNRETWAVLGLYLVFFLWWYLTAYGLGGGDPHNYKYIFGFPEWFFYSCIVGYIGITILLWVVVKCFFKDIPFDEEESHE